MTKKKKPAIKVSVEPVEQIDPTPPEEFPSVQVEEEPVEQPTEPVAEVEPVVETVPMVEPIVEVKPQPVVEPAQAPVKPKPLTMTSHHAEIEEVRKIVEGQATLIKQLLEAPVRQRKPPTSNGKVQIRDTKTEKIYPSKNNVYQSLLKAGELDDLVKQGVFCSDPAKNSFGCYNLFRAWPNRFEEVHEQEQSV